MTCKLALRFRSVNLLVLFAALLLLPSAFAQMPARHLPAPQLFDGQMDPAASLFLPTAIYKSHGQLAWSILTADMNGDGIPDVLVINYSSATKNGDGSVAVLLGNGDGTLQTAKAFDSGGWFTVSAAVGDLNGDGIPDVVVTSYCNSGCSSSQSVVRVLLGRGDGTLRPAGDYLTGGWPWSSGEGSTLPIMIADLNGDGRPDLVVVNQTVKSYADGVLGVLIGNGDGTFQPVVTYDTGGFVAGSFAIADLNGDGKLDLAVVNCAPSGTMNCPGSDGNVAVLLGRGNGTFHPARIFNRNGGGFTTGPILVADVNGDHKPDLLVGNFCAFANNNCVGDGSVSVLLGRGTGAFRPAVTYDAGGYAAVSMVLSDVNGDGKPDLVLANGIAGVLLANGDGTFQPVQNYFTAGNTGAVLVTDIDGDGIPDLVATNGTSNTVAVLQGKGDGTFNPEVTFPLGGAAYASPVVVADMNGDGNPDLVGATWCVNSKVCHVGGSEAGTVGVLLNANPPHNP
jgi:FG-GAP-like repeat